MDENAQTIRPHRSPSSGSTIPLAKLPTEIEPIIEDYSDLAGDEDEKKLEEKVADFKAR